jgi:hypothetical protein
MHSFFMTTQMTIRFKSVNSADLCSVILIHNDVSHSIKLLLVQIFTVCDIVEVSGIRESILLYFNKVKLSVHALKACWGVEI